MKILFFCFVLAIFHGELIKITKSVLDLISSHYAAINACDVLSEAHNGCKIENSQCICSFGCKSEFRYRTKKECTDALKVKTFVQRESISLFEQGAKGIYICRCSIKVTKKNMISFADYLL